MPKVITTYAYKIRSIVKEFPDEFVESINNQLYCNLCNCAVSCNKRFLVDSHQNTSKHQKALGSRSENFIPHTSQTFLKSSDTDFVEKVTKAVVNEPDKIFVYSFKGSKHSFTINPIYYFPVVNLSPMRFLQLKHYINTKYHYRFKPYH